MKTAAPQEWIVTRIDGRIASVAADYRHLAQIAGLIAVLPPGNIAEVRTEKITTDALIALDKTVGWDDFRLFGTSFQKRVWKRIYDLSHDGSPIRLHSYSELAALCENPQGVRPVAHAVAINPVAYLIPCHLIVPKESIDKAKAIRQTAESTLFKGSDLYLLDSIDVGEYAYGSDLKRMLIKHQLGG